MMREIRLRIGNMHCGACVQRVSQALEKVPGIQLGEVGVGGVRVQAPEDVPDSVLVGAVEQAGYSVVVES
jgi:copper chaperone